MRRGDIWLAVLLVIAIAAFAVPKLLPQQEESTETKRIARITVDGELYRTVELDGQERENIVIETARGYNMLEIHDDGIQMHEAECPDQLCLSFGLIRKMGDTIVCLPHRVIVEIIGGPDRGDVDVVVS